MEISEIFGFGAENLSEKAQNSRSAKLCPFRASPCTKSSTKDPIGICSLSDGEQAASLCPTRFIENNLIFYDAARIAFGDQSEFAIFPEVHILKVAGTEGVRDRKIGKVDFLIGKIEQKQIVDFAAIEVQAVYFSGNEIQSPFKHYLRTGKLVDAKRRPDFRSSAQKRLIPQLELKVPVFRRWGKKFFVVVDSHFFQELPTFQTTTESNSELTWLAYAIKKDGPDYSMATPRIIYSEWDEIKNSLREGKPPEPSEILNELNSKLGSSKYNLKVLRT